MGRDSDGGFGHGGPAFFGRSGSFGFLESREHPPLASASRDCDSDMDKDSRDDFTFAKLSDLKVPVTFRMSAGFIEFIMQNRAQESRIVHSSKDPGFLVLSPNFWRNRS